MRENGIMTKDTAMDRYNMRMVDPMSAIGDRIRSMAKEK